MKRIVLLTVALIFCVMLASCAEHPFEDRVAFTGRVIEKYDGSCLLELVESEESYLLTMDVVVVHIEEEKNLEYSVGDCLRIEFNGVVAESYPPQIFKVLSVELVV